MITGQRQMDAAHMIAPRKHGKQFRQAALIEAATHVFAEHGYDCATTREVAEHAGCSEGLIHNYFGGKHGLLMAVLESRTAGAAGEFEAAVAPSEDVREEIERIIFFSLENFARNSRFVRVCASQAAIDPAIGRMVGDRLNAERVSLIERRLDAHRASGHIRDGVDIEAVAEALAALGFSYGFFGQVVFEMHSHELARIARATADVIARGIASDPGAARGPNASKRTERRP